MGKVKKFILITFLSIIAIAFLISAYYLATYELPAPVDTRAVVTEKALNYLNERYGEDFEIVNFIDPEPYHNFYNIIAFPKGKPKEEEQKIIVHGWVTKTRKSSQKEKIDFYDNYTVAKLIPQIKNKISNIVLTDYPECKIHITFHKEWIQKNTNIYTSVEEFLAEDDYWKPSMSATIFTLNKTIDDKDKLKKYSKTLFNRLIEENFSGSVELCFYSNINIYKKLDTSLGQYGEWRYEDTDWGTCGKDFVYSWCSLKNEEQLKIHFEDK